MKKYISVICILLMLLTGCVFSHDSFATEQNEIKFRENSISARPGEEIEVIIETDTPSIGSFDAVFVYDNNLKMVNVQPLDGLKKFNYIVGIDYDENTGNVLTETQPTPTNKSAFFVGALDKGNINGDLEIAKLKFKVSENAQIGDKYTLKWEQDKCSISEDAKLKEVSFSNCEITIVGNTTEPAKPSNVKVSVTPTEATVKQEESKQFSVTVTGDNLTDKSVTWSVQGAKSANTKIDANGNLTVGSDESAEKISVVAVSKADNTASATATVTIEKKVTEPENEPEQKPDPVKPTNVKVSISPAEKVSVKQGESAKFTATVSGENVTDKSVIWNVKDAKSSKTKIATDGTLTVGSDESAEKLTVEAVSVTDNTASATVSVSIEKKASSNDDKQEGQQGNQSDKGNNQQGEQTKKPSTNNNQNSGNGQSLNNAPQLGNSTFIIASVIIVGLGIVAVVSYRKMKM